MNTLKDDSAVVLTVANCPTHPAIAIPLTVWVAQIMSHDEKVLLVYAREDKDDLADAVNELCLVGFYPLNIEFGAVLPADRRRRRFGARPGRGYRRQTRRRPPPPDWPVSPPQ